MSRICDPTSCPGRVQGVALYSQQLWAMLTKRALSASRDRLALWTQLAAPLLLVVAALAARAATSGLPQEPLLPINRYWLWIHSFLVCCKRHGTVTRPC